MPKRYNGEGTIYQRSNGLWVGEVTTGYATAADGKVKRIKKSFSSMDREKLLKLVNDEKHRLDRNIITHSSDYTVSDWMALWLTTYKLNHIKPKTYDNYDYAIRCHIRDAIGGVKLDKIRAEDIQRFYNQLLSRNLSSSTINIVNVTLNQAFAQAVKLNLIYTNPCAAATVPKGYKKHVTAMSPDEQALLVSLCDGSTSRNFFIFLLNTGLRCGEALALTWEDINFEDKSITVSKNVSTIKNRDASADAPRNITVISDTTKTASGNRTIPINKHALRILSAQRDNPASDFFVFASRNGAVLTHRNISRSFTGFIKSAGLPSKYSLHTLRHTFATRLLEKGVSPKVVSDILGHKSITITLNLYSHVMPSLKQDAVDLLD